MSHPKIVSREEWLAARKTLLAKEKALTRHRDEVSAERRKLPMVEISKDYVFDGPDGKIRLIDLFDGRSQLIVYHFMFDPNDPPAGQSAPFSEGCPGCSLVADNVAPIVHLHARDTSFVLVSRARRSKIEPFQKRMGWHIPWFSSYGSDFNYDFHATTDENVRPVEYNYQTKEQLEAKGESYHIKGEQHGFSVFLKIDGRIFHAYSSYGRGLDELMNTYGWLDHTPFGRQEDWEKSPEGWPQTPKNLWVRHRDRYEMSQPGECCGAKK